MQTLIVIIKKFYFCAVRYLETAHNSFKTKLVSNVITNLYFLEPV